MASTPKQEVRATAKVRVTLEVRTGTWGKDCSVTQLFKQAGDDALTAVRNLVTNDSTIKIVGEPEVFAVIGVE